jgi:hypothetical protein
MDSQVRVASLDAFQEFRAAYAKFGERSQHALTLVDVEIQRMLEWLGTEMVAFWKAEIRRREDKVNEAKAALHRKRITARFGETAADSEEVHLVRKAQARMHDAEEKLKLVKHWYLVIEQEVTEYRGPSQQLKNVLDASVPRALAGLDRMFEVLESYLAVAPPGADAVAAAFSAAGTDPAVVAAASEGTTKDAAGPGNADEATGAEDGVDTEGAVGETGDGRDPDREPTRLRSWGEPKP